MENEAVAVERGAMMAGGWRFANALAGHRALRASIVMACSVWSGEVREVWVSELLSRCLRWVFGLGELDVTRYVDLPRTSSDNALATSRVCDVGGSRRRYVISSSSDNC